MADKLDLSGARIVQSDVAPARPGVNTPGIDAVMGEGGGAARRERLASGAWRGSGPSWMGPFGDEFAAGVGAASDYVRGQFTADQPPSLRQLYDENLGLTQEAQAQYREDAPLTSLGKEVAFGMAALPPAVTGRVISALPQTSLWSGLKSAAGFGAAGGAAAGFGEGRGGFENRLNSAAGGAALGAATGVGLQGLAEITMRVARGLSYVRGLKGEGAIRRAGELLEEAMRKDGVTPERVRELAASGKPISLADLGPNTQALVGSAVRAGGEGRAAITETFENRARGQFERMNEDLARVSGADPRVFGQAEESLEGLRAQAAGEMYPQAYLVDPPQLSGNARSILEDTHIGRKAVSDATEFMENLRAPIFTEDGRYTVQMMDQIGRAMRDLREGARGNRGTERAGVIDTVRSQYLAELPPDLRATMDMYRTRSELLDALRGGREFFKDDAEVVARGFAEMSPSQKALFRLGVARELRGRMARRIDTGDISGMFQNPAIREKLEVVFDDMDALRTFLDATRTERLMQETRNALLKGSPTAARIADDESFAAGVLGEAAEDAVRSGSTSVGATSAVVNAAINLGRQARDRILSGVNEEVANQIARAATNMDVRGARRDVAVRTPPPPAPRIRRGVYATQVPAAIGAGSLGTRQPPDDRPMPSMNRLDLQGARRIR